MVRARLTARGSALMARIFPEHAASIARAVALLSPREQAVLAQLLKKWGKTLRAEEG